MDFFNVEQLQEYIGGGIFGLAVLVLLIRKVLNRGSKKNKPKKDSDGGYIDDMRADPNGIQDITVVGAMFRYMGIRPKFFGASYDKPGRVSTRDMRHQVDRMHWGKVPVLGGSPHPFGSGGPSDLSKAIVNRCNEAKGDFVLGVGSQLTDVAYAIQQDPGIVRKLRLSFMGASNIGKDKRAYDFVMKKMPADRISGVDIRNPGGKDVYRWIRPGSGHDHGNQWMKDYFGSSIAGSYVLSEEHQLKEAYRLNVGQTGARYSTRLADFAPMAIPFYGRKTFDVPYMFGEIEKWLGGLPSEG